VRREQRRDAGQDLVEMALILPLLLALLLGIIEFGVAVWRYNTLANAAREGARAGVVHRCERPAIEAAIARLDVGLVPTPTVAITMTAEPDADLCTVAVYYTHALLTGSYLGVGTSIPLTATSSMIIE